MPKNGPGSIDLSDLQKAARHLLNDIESMAAGPEFEFGEFGEWRSAGEDGVVIAWPNLAISVARLREAPRGVAAESGRLTSDRS